MRQRMSQESSADGLSTTKACMARSEEGAQARRLKTWKYVLLYGDQILPITTHSKTGVSARIVLYHLIYNHNNAKLTSLAEWLKMQSK